MCCKGVFNVLKYKKTGILFFKFLTMAKSLIAIA